MSLSSVGNYEYLNHVGVTLLSVRGVRVGRHSSVGIATRSGLEGPGIESRWGRNFRTHPDGPWGPPV